MEVYKLDIDKLEKLNVDHELTPVPTNFSKLSEVVKNDVNKKTEYDELAKKVNATDISKQNRL